MAEDCYKLEVDIDAICQRLAPLRELPAATAPVRLSYTDGCLTLAVLGITVQTPARGEWPNPIIVDGSLLPVLAAGLGKGEGTTRIALSFADSRLQVGDWGSFKARPEVRSRKRWTRCCFRFLFGLIVVVLAASLVGAVLLCKSCPRLAGSEWWRWAVGLIGISVLAGIPLSRGWMALVRRAMAFETKSPLEHHPSAGWFTGVIERLFFTVAIAVDLSGTATGMILWITIKHYVFWRSEASTSPNIRWPGSALASLGSMLIAVAGGLVCRGWLWTPAQAATSQPSQPLATAGAGASVVDWLGLLIQVLVAVGTVGAVLVAVFHDSIRGWLARPQLRIVARPSQQCYKCPVLDSEGRVIPTYWLGLAVSNVRPSRPALACQVLLEGMYRWNATDKRWEENCPPIPYPFAWAPGHLRNASVTVRRNAVFDFGRISMPVMAFVPELQYCAIGYDPSLGPEVTGLYVLRVEAKHLAQGVRQVWQVRWDGTWDERPESMATHVQMKEVSLEEFEKIIQQQSLPGGGQ